MKTVRFAQVVAKSGRPEAYTLWTKPEDDAGFRAALKGHRVLTVHQDNVGTKTDYGTVGFKKDAKGSLLIFPKSLEPFEGRRVIGIRYDLLAGPKRAATPKPAPKARAASKAGVRPARQRGRKKTAVKEAPLRVFNPEEVSASAARPAHSKATEKQTPSATAAADPQGLLRAMKKAMKQLEQGKAVTAHQTLEAALAKTP